MNYVEELDRIYNTKAPNYSNDFLNKEIILYGAGSLGHMAYDLLNKTGIKPKYFADKNAKGNICGINIVSPDAISQEDKQNCLFLVCICTIAYNDIKNFLHYIGINNIMQFYTYADIQFPHLLSNGWNCRDISDNEKKAVQDVCFALMHDKLSLYHYLQFLWWKLREEEYVYANFPVLSGKKFFKSPSMPKLHNREILLDGGCHFGQTIETFIEITDNEFKKIYAFEPDEKNLAICKEKFNDERIAYSDSALSNKCGEFAFCDNLGYASKLSTKGEKKVQTKTIDSLNLNPTIIKLHIEGTEYEALKGAVETIKKHRPIIMVMADHNSDGLYKTAQFLKELKDYKLYFNLHDYCGNSAVYYAIPKERE